jgi:putative endonuclease
VGQKRTGTYGEQIAVQYLQQKDYQIIATNWHCARGELDIIAREGETVVFVEVKTRRKANTDNVLASITPRKRERLIASVYAYLDEYEPDNPPWRFDVIAVALPHTDQPVIDHVEDALDW